MPYYAQLNDDGIAVAVTQTHGPLTGPGLVAIESLDTAVLGRRRVGSQWVEVPQPAPVTLTNLAFRSRFTEGEKIAIYTLAASDLRVRIWLDDLNAAQEIRIDDARIVAGLGVLSAAGVIDPARVDEILGPVE